MTSNMRNGVYKLN